MRNHADSVKSADSNGSHSTLSNMPGESGNSNKENGGQAHATQIPQEKSHRVRKPGHKGANTRT
jgi:hypothetical protein